MIIGFDEAGRGCWAGPLVVAAVRADTVDGVADSKTLSKQKRARIASLLHAQLEFGVGWAWPSEVDTWGLTRATTLAATRALTYINTRTRNDRLIFDGSYNFLPNEKHVQTAVRGDAFISAISAASIIAKVARDAYMHHISPEYPQFQFESHVGYGTAMHKRALEQYGPTSLHRLSYKPVASAFERFVRTSELSS